MKNKGEKRKYFFKIFSEQKKIRFISIKKKELQWFTKHIKSYTLGVHLIILVVFDKTTVFQSILKINFLTLGNIVHL